MHDKSRAVGGLKLFKTRAKREVRRGVFSQRVVDDWNSLPEEVVTADSINSFKNRLDKVWEDDQYRNLFDETSVIPRQRWSTHLLI